MVELVGQKNVKLREDDRRVSSFSCEGIGALNLCVIYVCVPSE